MGVIVVSGGVSKALFNDDFNRANGSLGANWTNGNGTPPQITSNAAAMSGTTDGLYPSKYNSSVNTNSYFVQATCVNPTSVSSGIIIRLPASGWTIYVILFCGNASSAIGTANTSAGGGYTNRTTGGPSYANGDTIRIECVNNVYTAKKNGSTTISWTDSGNLVPVAATNRTGGLIMQRASFTNSGGFDNFSMGDL